MVCRSFRRSAGAGEALVREVVGSLCCKRVTVAATTRCGCRWERARFKQDGIGVEQRARVAQVMRAFRIFRMLVVLARPKGSVQYLGRHDVPTVPYCTCWSLALFETKPDLRKPSPQSSTGTFSPRQSTNGPILSASTKPSNRPTIQRPPKAGLRPLTDSLCLSRSRGARRRGNHPPQRGAPSCTLQVSHFESQPATSLHSSLSTVHTTTSALVVRCLLDRCPVDHAPSTDLPPRLPPPLHCRLH